MTAADASRLRALEQAYRATTYRVEVPAGSGIAIRVGDRHGALDALLAERAAASWMYVTAYNPGSVRRSDAENEEAQRRLVEDVTRGGAVAIYRGFSVGDDGAWPPEPSLLVLGPSRDEARAIGRRFGQLAVVCGERGGPAELLWCT